MWSQRVPALFVASAVTFLFALMVLLIAVEAYERNLSTQVLGWSIVSVGIGGLGFFVFLSWRSYVRIVRDGNFEDKLTNFRPEAKIRKRNLIVAFVNLFVSTPFVLGIYYSIKQNDFKGSIFFDAISILLLLSAFRFFWRYKESKTGSQKPSGIS